MITMSDRINTITVVLTENVRDDDAECILNALRMVKGVQSAKGNVADSEAYMAESRALAKVHKQVFDAIYPRKSNDA